MNKDVVIKVTNLSKSFSLSHSGANSIKTKLMWFKKSTIEKLDVLKGIDFEVHKGECVSVIGRNGAGKSTLLALLARVYKPSSGIIEVNGRVAPLLELGAGFHPDLSGSENVFFNGIILGLSRKEITKRLDAIIDFSEIRDHIDSPVRTYSSGMLARLGFAVAVHVDADALLVDEVLAVGDRSFEQKCYKKIEEFRSNGGTIFFVSHQLDAVRKVSDRCLWIRDGKIVMEGTPDEVTLSYEQAFVDL
jgi:ABC-type polysaccharide/polyol phosphate transport system ATPase subunit